MRSHIKSSRCQSINTTRFKNLLDKISTRFCLWDLYMICLGGECVFALLCICNRELIGGAFLITTVLFGIDSRWTLRRGSLYMTLLLQVISLIIFFIGLCTGMGSMIIWRESAGYIILCLVEIMSISVWLTVTVLLTRRTLQSDIPDAKHKQSLSLPVSIPIGSNKINNTIPKNESLRVIENQNIMKKSLQTTDSCQINTKIGVKPEYAGHMNQIQGLDQQDNDSNETEENGFNFNSAHGIDSTSVHYNEESNFDIYNDLEKRYTAQEYDVNDTFMHASNNFNTGYAQYNPNKHLSSGYCDCSACQPNQIFIQQRHHLDNQFQYQNNSNLKSTSKPNLMRFNPNLLETSTQVEIATTPVYGADDVAKAAQASIDQESLYEPNSHSQSHSHLQTQSNLTSTASTFETQSNILARNSLPNHIPNRLSFGNLYTKQKDQSPSYNTQIQTKLTPISPLNQHTFLYTQSSHTKSTVPDGLTLAQPPPTKNLQDIKPSLFNRCLVKHQDKEPLEPPPRPFARLCN